MRLLPLAGLVLLAACQPAPPPEMTDADRQAIAEEIHQQTLGWMTADLNGDMEASLAYFVEDAEGGWVSEPALFMNRRVLFPTKAAVREWFGQFFVDGRAMPWSLGQESVAVLSSDHAVQIFEGTYSVVDSLGNKGPEIPATVTTVWVRQEGEWKILHCHQS